MLCFPSAKNNRNSGLGAVKTADAVVRVHRGHRLNIFRVARVAVDERHRQISVHLFESIELLDNVGDFHTA